MVTRSTVNTLVYLIISTGSVPYEFFLVIHLLISATASLFSLFFSVVPRSQSRLVQGKTVHT